MLKFTVEEEERLFSLYSQKKNDYQVAQIMRVSRNRLRYWRDEHKISSRTNKKGLTKEICVDVLKLREAGESFSQIAQKYGATRTSITKLLNKNGFSYGIPNRQVPDWVSDYRFTPHQRSVLIGDLFGDGHLNRASKRSAYYSCSHSPEQEEFILYKAMIFAPLSNRIYYGNSVDGPYIAMTSWSCPYLVDFHNKFYPSGDGDKILPKEMSLDVQGLAIWYMGDGGKHRNEARFTVGVAIDLDPIILLLNKTFNNLFRAKRYTSQWTVFVNDQERFFKIVGPFIVPALQYKVPEKYRHYCTGDFSELLQLKEKINNERLGKIPFRVLL
jgi:LAGLIDADG DNA endonuclease family.